MTSASGWVYALRRHTTPPTPFPRGLPLCRGARRPVAKACRNLGDHRSGWPRGIRADRRCAPGRRSPAAGIGCQRWWTAARTGTACHRACATATPISRNRRRHCPIGSGNGRLLRVARTTAAGRSLHARSCSHIRGLEDPRPRGGPGYEPLGVRSFAESGQTVGMT